MRSAIMFRILIGFIAIAWLQPIGTLFSQEYQRRYDLIDIQHYRFELFLNDTTNVISGRAIVDIRFKADDVENVDLDFMAFDSWIDKGMEISMITSFSKPLKYDHEDETLTIYPRKRVWKDDVRSFSITYSGVPEDGLIIGKNKFGDRTFFGDNWPNRAKYWLPTVDHPSDKATVEFIVNAPDHYRIVANGTEISRESVNEGYQKTHWKADVLLPTKVMVIGAAPFSVQESGKVNGVPVTTWVFPQNEEDGFYDFEPAVEILEYLTEKIGQYPYRKLANVQSKTRFGGMENASNIFYFENAVNGKRERNFLIAHEIAHQWFGNSASEIDWPHVWLSEGFATYMTHLYAEETIGEELFKERMKIDRDKVTKFANERKTPVVDKSTRDYMTLLNANSYQKGSWVLHMLRNKVGDEYFIKGIRTYYNRYKYANASTSDFQKIMESVSGRNLDQFFNQWLFRSGHPILKTTWEQSGTKVKLTIDQKQDVPFSFPLTISLVTPQGEDAKSLIIDQESQTFDFKYEGELTGINLDPEVKLLYESFNQ